MEVSSKILNIFFKMYYPRTLKSQWYLADVHISITTSLEAIKNWTACYYVSPIDRAAYLDTFARCQRIVEDNKLKPDDMLIVLDELHDQLLATPLPSIFSRTRWFHAPLEARKEAVAIAFLIVQSISNRFLP